MSFSCALPPLLQALHQLPVAYVDGQGIDLLPLAALQTAAKTKAWIKTWTGNSTLTGSEYRVFAHDRTGGTAAFWLVHPDVALLHQPIVFFGSQGELGVVAVDFADYLWLLAAGVGPSEAMVLGVEDAVPNPTFLAFAATHAPSAEEAAAMHTKNS
jgi:hypothetical protein